jgi:hypothetical protein
MAFEAIKAGLSVFQRGKAVANPQTWRTYGVAVQAVVGLLVAVVGLLRANGYALAVSDDTIKLLATGVVSLWFGGFGVYRVITSPDRGLPARRPADGDGDAQG